MDEHETLVEETPTTICDWCESAIDNTDPRNNGSDGSVLCSYECWELHENHKRRMKLREKDAMNLAKKKKEAKKTSTS